MYEDIKKVKTKGFVCESSRRGKVASRQRKKREEESVNRGGGLLIRTAVCAMLLGAVLLIMYVNLPVTNKMKAAVVSALTFEIDVDKSLGKLKYVQSNDSNVQDVMSSNSSGIKMTLPIKNAVAVSNYSEGSTAMVFEASELTDVISPYSGIVENVDSDKNFEITIDHGNDTKSVLTFNGAMAVIKEGSVLKKGDYVGLVDKGATVNFSVINKGQNVDPSSYLEQQ